MKTSKTIVALLLGSALQACAFSNGSAPMVVRAEDQPLHAPDAGTPVDGDAGAQVEELAPPHRDAGVTAASDAGGLPCAELGERCETGSNTCCNGYCLAGYTVGECIPLAADGEWCEGHAMCASGRCGDGVCRQAECQAAAAQCYFDGECCTGFCTYTGQTYAPGGCSTPQPTGTACAEARWCRSGVCHEGICL